MKHNMQILQEAAAKLGPLCVGLDIDPSYIPQCAAKEFGSAAQAVLAYNKEIISRVKSAGSACCFKIQIAYYEAMGLEGLKVYAETLRQVKKAGFIAISDIKRGDIAASADAYAKGHFSGDFETDIITVNPYMGFETLKPFTAWCNSKGKGIFVLFRTSNPGMTDLEGQELKSGGLLLDRVGCELNRLEKNLRQQMNLRPKLAVQWVRLLAAQARTMRQNLGQGILKSSSLFRATVLREAVQGLRLHFLKMLAERLTLPAEFCAPGKSQRPVCKRKRKESLP